MSESKSPNSLVRRFDPFATREITTEEKEYHEEQYPDDDKLLKRKTIECSSCGKDIRRAIVHDYKLCIHPALDVIICNKCEQFYNDGEFSVDEDGSDKYCRWCGQGGNLYCCCDCSVALCSRCVKKNLPRSYSKEIERDDWKCFVCDPEPIWSFRALCYAAKRYVDNHGRSKTSKRSRTITSDSGSDVARKVTRKRSKREEEEEDSENSHSEEENEDPKPSRSRDSDSDSDAIWASSTRKRASRSRPSKSPWPVKKPLKPRRAKATSGEESSSASNTRASRRNRRTNSSDSSTISRKAKRTPRNKDDDESDDTSFVTPATKATPKRPSSQTSPKKKKKDLLGLAVIDNNNDFCQLVKIVTKNQSDFESKYLKNNKNQDPAQWQKIKKKYVKLLNNTVNCMVELRDSFLKCSEKIENEDKSINGDASAEKNSINGDVSNSRCADDDNDTSMNGDDSPKKESESSVAERNEEAHVEKMETDETNEMNDTANEETAVSQNGESTREVPAENESMDVQIGDSTVEQDEKVESSPDKSANESPSVGSPTHAEKSATPSNHAKEESSSDSAAPSSRQNGHVSADEESDSESISNKNVDVEIKSRAELRDHCTVKLPRIPDSVGADPREPSDSAENTTIESESETSRIDTQPSDTDGVETKRTGRAELQQLSFFESTRIDSDNADVLPAEVFDKTVAKEDEAKKSLLNSTSSSEDEEETDLNESSVIAGIKKDRFRPLVTFSDLDEYDSAGSRESSKVIRIDSSGVIKDKTGTNTSGSGNKLIAHEETKEDISPSLTEAEDSMKPDDPMMEERDMSALKEEQAKKSFLDSDSENESHVSDSDADPDDECIKSSFNKQPLSEEVLFSDDSADEGEGEKMANGIGERTAEGTAKNDLLNDSSPEIDSWMAEEDAKNDLLDDSSPETTSRVAEEDAKKDFFNDSSPETTSRVAEEDAKKDFFNDSSPETTSRVAEEDAKKDFFNDSSPETTSRVAEEDAKKDFFNDSGPETTSRVAEEDAKKDFFNDSSPEEMPKQTVVKKLRVRQKNKGNDEEKAKKKLLDSSSSNDSDSDEKEIRRLTNLNTLERKRQRPQFTSSDEADAVVPEVMEVDSKSAEETVAATSAKKKRLLKSKTSLEHYLTENDEESSPDELSFSTFRSQMFEKQKNYTTKEDVAKKLLLGSGTTEESGSDSSDFAFVKDALPKKRAKKENPQQKSSSAADENMEIQVISDSSDDEKKKSEATTSDDVTKKKKKKNEQWKNDSLLRGKLSATDTSDEERMIQRARKKYDLKANQKKATAGESSGSEDIFVTRSKKPVAAKRKRFVLHSSNSEEDVEIQTLSSASSSDEDAKKAKQKTQKKRKRIRKPVSDDTPSEEEANATQSSLKGRKNIREIMKVRDLDAQTRRMGKEEEARKKRIAERQAMFNEVFQIQDARDVALKKLVLDYDTETKEELVTVCPKLFGKLKPHQADGVKFMWNACFESLKQVAKGKGGGCILAHCMGLGKTLQVISLIHTLIRHEETKVKTVLVICPLTTVLNWRDEFDKWLEDLDDYSDFNVYELTKYKNNAVRADHLRHWTSNGGIMILGYEMFRSLVNGKNMKEKVKKQISSSLLDPGPDLVICDEGHILKNEKSAVSIATMKIKSLRRIVLTGTPLQNNLIEYHCMVQFVKPNLLGNKKEFQNRFVNPITNGQYVDSTPRDVRLMKSRAHILHRILDGIVQRFDYNVLKPFLPPKHEFVISIGLSDLQAKLYDYYIKNKSHQATSGLFKDYQVMRLIWTHPLAMKLAADTHQKKQDKEESDSSMKNFVVSGSESEGTASENSVVTLSSGDETKKPTARLTRAKKNELGIDLEAQQDSPPEVMNHWWNEFVSGDDLEDYKQGPKLMLLFAILRQCELIGDKVLIFSQSIPSLDMIEYFLTKNEEFSQRLPEDSCLSTEGEDFIGTWEKNKDYFRLDGQTPNEVRSRYCKAFNNPNNIRTRLFLISTKAGGLGINLTAANRVIIFDASWNPSYDIQSIFRVYRFGQSKPCYVYRFLSQGTMEEKIYERQVTKLSVSCRVVDEQQIDRHFTRKDISELYTFSRKSPNMNEVPKLPSDRLMAELLKEYRDVIINYHEHDSLLENVEEEELTEEERKAAWQDYEEEKNRPAYRPQAVPNVLLQEVHKTISDQSIIQTIKKLHPTATPQQLSGMLGTVRQKLIDYYLSQSKSQNPGNNASSANPVPGTSTQNSATDQQAQNSMQLKQSAVLQALQNPLPSTSTQFSRAPQVAPRPRFLTAPNNFFPPNWPRPSTPNVPGPVRPRPTQMTPVVRPPPDPLA